MLATGNVWLESKRHASMSHPVIYRRGNESVTLNATNGRDEFEVLDSDGLAIQVESTDFLIRAADLILANELTTPMPGDRIEEYGKVYEVNRFFGQPHFRNSDPAGLTLRIHTKLTA